MFGSQSMNLDKQFVFCLLLFVLVRPKGGYYELNWRNYEEFVNQNQIGVTLLVNLAYQLVLVL